MPRNQFPISKLVLGRISIPLDTEGRCRKCQRYGELGDGLCMSCWDKTPDIRDSKLRINSRIRCREKKQKSKEGI